MRGVDLEVEYRECEKKAVFWKEGLLSFFFPHKCALCGRVGFYGLCRRCQSRVERAFSPEVFLPGGGRGHADEMFTLFSYDDACIRALLFDLKRHPYPDLTDIFRPFIKRVVEKKQFFKHIHVITYLPRRNSARRTAGLDQAEILARLLSEILQVPMIPLLRRRAFSRSQHALGFEQREKNVKRAFAPIRELCGETVLFVDDIVTSGATARAGARALKKAGAMKVYLFALAH